LIFVANKKRTSTGSIATGAERDGVITPCDPKKEAEARDILASYKEKYYWTGNLLNPL